jgi:hypothetical protein
MAADAALWKKVLLQQGRRLHWRWSVQRSTRKSSSASSLPGSVISPGATRGSARYFGSGALTRIAAVMREQAGQARERDICSSRGVVAIGPLLLALRSPPAGPPASFAHSCPPRHLVAPYGFQVHKHEAMFAARFAERRSVGTQPFGCAGAWLGA